MENHSVNRSNKFIYMITGIVAIGVLIGLIKLVPWNSLLNIATWIMVVGIELFALYALYKDLDILGKNACELRELGNIITNQIYIVQDSDGEQSKKGIRVLSVDEITEILRDTPLYMQWRNLTINGVNTCTVYGFTFIKDDIHKLLTVDYFMRQLERALWRQQIPQLLTGAGILGTFFGLTAGLYGLNIFSNGQELIHQMGTLISSSGTAFFTSLVGIAFSLLYAIALIENTKSIKREYNQVVNILHSCTPYKSEAEYLGDIITGNARSSAQLVTHVQEIQEAFSKSMNTMVENVGATIGAMVSHQVKDLQDKVVALDTTVQTMREQTEHLSSALDTYNSSLTEQVNAVVNFTKDMRSQIQTINDNNLNNTKDVVDNFKLHMVDTSNILENMGSLQKNFEQNMGKLQKNFEQNIKVMQDGFKEQITELNGDYKTNIVEQGKCLKNTVINTMEAIEKAEKVFLQRKEESLKLYVEDLGTISTLLGEQIKNQKDLNLKVNESIDDFDNLRIKILEKMEIDEVSVSSKADVHSGNLLSSANEEHENLSMGNGAVTSDVANSVVERPYIPGVGPSYAKGAEIEEDFDVEEDQIEEENSSFIRISEYKIDRREEVSSVHSSEKSENTFVEEKAKSQNNTDNIEIKKEVSEMTTYEGSDLY